MDWTAIGAIGTALGAVAVLITLLYLARQIRQLNRHNLLIAYQHTFSSMNAWCTLVSENAELGSIILRGRESYDGLNEEDRWRFDHVHFFVLNIIEAHLYQVQQTALDREYREWALTNLKLIARGYLDHPGTRTFWNNVSAFAPPEVQRLVSESIGGTQDQEDSLGAQAEPKDAGILTRR